MRKKLPTRKKLATSLVSFLVLMVVLIPSLLSVKWVSSLAGAHDPRKTTFVAPIQTRPADNTSAPLKPFAEPIVTISFDDGWESVYTQALPILQQDGIHTTQYIISGTMANNYVYMSVAQLQSMQKAGHEIAGHTVNHTDLTILDDQQLTYQLAASKDTLTKDFGPIKDFTSPYGAYNAHTLAMIGKYYRSQKNSEGDPASNELEAINIRSRFNPLNITSYAVRQTTTSADIKKLLKAAQDNNGWLVLTYHQVDNSKDPYAVTPEVFAKQMFIIDQSNMRSATVGQVLNVLLPGDRAGS